MKKRISILAMIAGMLLSFNGMSQKLGHINAEELLAAMPEAKVAQASLEAYGKQLEKQIADMTAELELKVKEYRENEALWIPLTKSAKEQEINQMQERIQNFNQQAQYDLQNKQIELLQPVIAKATQAVKDVALEGKFTYIFDASPSKAVLIFTDNGEDIMPLVKAKLGII